MPVPFFQCFLFCLRYASYSWDKNEESRFCDLMHRDVKRWHKLVHEGHFYYVPCPDRDGIQFSWMNMLRDPIERLISMYHYIRHRTRYDKNTKAKNVTGPSKVILNYNQKHNVNYSPAQKREILLTSRQISSGHKRMYSYVPDAALIRLHFLFKASLLLIQSKFWNIPNVLNQIFKFLKTLYINR